MDSERSYTCLACPPALRVPMFGRVRSHLHVAREHGHLLESMHVDELLEQLPVFEQLEIEVPPVVDFGPPFICLRCAFPHHPGSLAYGDEQAIEYHLRVKHSCHYAVFGVEYEDKAAKGRRDSEVERYAATVHSLVGVTEFLTECGPLAE